jgi:formylglycine-generating enzyme required for sulfatase activity
MTTFGTIVNRGLHSLIRRTRVMRGGCYVSVPGEMEVCPTRVRGGCQPKQQGTIDGFRVVRSCSGEAEARDEHN